MNNAPNVFTPPASTAPQAQFGFVPAAEPELDLVAEVVTILNEHGLQAKVPLFTNHRWVRDALGIQMAGQRFLLNRYWGTVLMSVAPTVPSIDERICLVHDGLATDWLRLFKTKIIPFCMAYDLPRAP